LLRRLDEYAIDGIAFHSTRTCRAMTNPQSMLARAAEAERGVKSFVFEGDVADASFYNDELFDSRLEAMLEAIDVQRMRSAV
jgi:benzoyl-CoA reductase/2-hydroxyglutaryl-CoA dehydratase subunit BcrC/BadD/HgdB